MKYSSHIKFLLYIIIGLLALLGSCTSEKKLNDKSIVIVATFMQYACGDWNDDMRIDSISDTTLNYLVGSYIDPEFINGETEIRGSLYDNGYRNSYTYRLKGYISKSAVSGCEKSTPKFWIENIEKINGGKFYTLGEN